MNGGRVHSEPLYEGGLKSFRPNNDTRHFFLIFFLIFLHSLLVTLHTSPSDAPISLTHQNSTRHFSLQNNCSRRWLPAHLKKTSVLRGQFLDEGTKRSRFGLDLGSMAYGQAVQTVIHGFSPWRPLRCETAQTSKRGTQRADSRLMAKSWCNMWQTRSLDIFTTSAISLTLIQRSSSTIWWTLAMLSSAVAVFAVSQALTATFKFSCPTFHWGKWWSIVPIHSVQLNFDLRRRIAFQKQIFNDRSILNFFHFHKNTHIDSLKRLSTKNCESKLAETLVSNCQKMHNYIH